MGNELISAMQETPKDSASFVVNWLKKRDRIQYLLKAGISGDKLKKELLFDDSELKYYESKGIIKKIENNKYILTIKGMIKSIDLCLNNENNENYLIDNFIKKLFDSETITLFKENKRYNSEEKIWLFSMIILNCFDLDTSIDVLDNEHNKKIYVELYNKIGEFMKSQKIINEYKPITGKEFLRRELEHINKKLYIISFNKERKSFYIDINSNNNKKEILIKLFESIFENNLNNKSKFDAVCDFMISCQPYVFKLMRKKIKTMDWNPLVNEAFNEFFINK